MQVPCHFVPQLQMEMLASGANSALIVSRSATKVLLLLEHLKDVIGTLVVETCIWGSAKKSLAVRSSGFLMSGIGNIDVCIIATLWLTSLEKKCLQHRFH